MFCSFKTKPQAKGMGMETLKKIEEIIKNHELGSILLLQPAYEFASIGSNGIFHVQTNLGDFSIKFINDPSKLKERITYHRLLCQLIPMPKILFQQENYFILEFLKGECLLSKATNSHLNGYCRFFETSIQILADLWQKTAGQNLTRNCSELKMAGELLRDFLGQAYELPVIANGHNMKLTAKQVFDNTLAHLQKSPLRCLAHGDAHLDNIIVRDNGKLAFIDARPGLSWLDDLTITGWQRNFRFVEFFNPPEVKTRNAISVDFKLKPSLFEKKAWDISWQIGEKIAGKLNCNWPRDFYLTLAASAFCEIAGVLNRKKRGVLDRDLPRNIEYFWLVEAIQNYSLSQKNNPSLI